MKIVKHQSLLESISGISPNISWLSVVLRRFLREVKPGTYSKVEEVLDDLILGFSRLTGEANDLNGKAVKVEVGTVLLVTNDYQLTTIESPAVVVLKGDATLENRRYVEGKLREALADAIIERQEVEAT